MKKIIKRTLLLMAMLLACAMQSRATDFTYDGLKYTVLTDSTCETKQGYYFPSVNAITFGNNVSGDLVIPEIAYDESGTNYSVTSIGNYSFPFCTGLTSVSIPNSVTSIGDRTFYDCYRITSMTIPNSVTSIGIYAFAECTGLTSVTISDSVSKISDCMFGECTSLAEIVIPNSVSEIGYAAFYGCSGLMDVIIGNSVTTIGSSAFYGCTAIRSVVSRSTTPPTISDADSAFSGETYLEGVLYVPDASIEAYQAAAGWKNFWEVKPLSEYSGVDEIVVDNAVDAISVDGGAICVSGDVPVRIVAINGRTVYSGRGDARVNVTPGIYVVIVGNTAHKVAVR